MAAYTGTSSDGSTLGLLPTSALEDVLAFDMSPFTCWPDTPATFGTAADGTAPVSVDAFTGVSSPDYGELWYNRIHLLPNRINVGNLTTRQVRPIEIFNGWFEPREISAITATDLNGVAFDVTLPLNLAALESVYRNLEIDTVGSPVFDGFFEVTADDSISPYFLYVTGQRVLVLPFQHNWVDKIVERLAWYSSSSKSLNGIEQIVALRNKPRRSLDYQVLLASTQTNAHRLRALFMALMYGWQSRLFVVPIWTDATRLTGDAASGQDLIPVNTACFDYDVGAYIMLWRDEETYEVAEILAVNANSIQITVNLVGDWAAQRTVVMPGRLGYVSQNLQGTSHTPDINSVPVSIELIPQHVSENRLVAATEVTYRGYPVLLASNNWAQGQSFEIQSQTIRSDSDTGIFSIERVQPTPDGGGTFAFLMANHVQVANFYSWLDNRKGRVGVFWLPTWAHDMVVTDDIGTADTTLLIENIGYTSLYYVDGAPTYNRRDVMIRLKNGTYHFRRITGVTLDTITNKETVSINAALGLTVAVSDIDRVCFLVPSCLRADAVEVAWESGNVSQSQIAIADVYSPTI